MAPPTYADLGKSARDLFSKGYSEYIIDLLNVRNEPKQTAF